MGLTPLCSMHRGVSLSRGDGASTNTCWTWSAGDVHAAVWHAGVCIRVDSPALQTSVGSAPQRGAAFPYWLLWGGLDPLALFFFDAHVDALESDKRRAWAPVRIEDPKRRLLVNRVPLLAPQDGEIHIPKEHDADP